MTTNRAAGDSWFAGLRSALVTGLLLIVLALAVALAVVPKVLDGAALTVLTGSMEPTLSPGDVVVVRGVKDPAAQVQIGDVVAFQPVSNDPTLITHRVVAKTFTSTGTQFVTRGDANGADDDPIEPAQVKGVMVYHVPWIGHVMLWLGDRRPIVVGALAVALLAYAGFMIFRPSRPKASADEPTSLPASAPAAPPTPGPQVAPQPDDPDHVEDPDEPRRSGRHGAGS